MLSPTVKGYVAAAKESLKADIADFEGEEGRKPCLAIIQVGDNPASNSYVKGKAKDSAEVGAEALVFKLPEDTSEKALLKMIKRLSRKKKVDGLIVQLPLPKGIDPEKVKLAVPPSKDVDGFHPLSPYDPGTPKGIIGYLKACQFSFEGANAVVIGRSDIVGKPMARLLLKENCNVTVLHSKTERPDMERYVANADLIVVAVGKKHFLDKTFNFKESCVIIDVGINRDESGLCGDCEPGLPVAAQTPVPGGVGLITRVTLLETLMKAARRKEA